MSKIIEKNATWFMGIIPLVVGFIFLAQEMGWAAVLPAGVTLWPTLVFLFGLIYVLMAYLK